MRPAGSSDERRGDEVRRRPGACALDRGLEEHLSSGAGHAREQGREAAVSWLGGSAQIEGDGRSEVIGLALKYRGKWAAALG